MFTAVRERRALEQRRTRYFVAFSMFQFPPNLDGVAPVEICWSGATCSAANKKQHQLPYLLCDDHQGSLNGW